MKLTPTSVQLGPEDRKLLRKIKAEAGKKFPGFNVISVSAIVRLGLQALAKEWGIYEI